MASQINYLDDFLQMARTDIKSMVFDKRTINQIQKSIDEWLKTKKRLDTNLYSQYQSLNKTKSLGRASSSQGQVDLSSKNLRAMLRQRKRIVGVRTLEETVEHFKKGYELIHRVRELLTGQEIEYSILYQGTKKSGGKMLEAKLSLDDVLSNVKLAVSDVAQVKSDSEMSKAIKLSVDNSAIRKTVNALSQADNMLENALVTVELDRVLWDSLVSFSEGQGSTNNMGYVYEAYTQLKRIDRYQGINFIGHRPGEANTENLAADLLRDAIKNNDPGWQKGDVALEQLKAVFKSAASLISVSAIEFVLTQTKKALAIDTNKDMAEELKKIFTAQGSNFNSDLDERLTEEAIAAIDETVGKVDLSIDIDIG